MFVEILESRQKILLLTESAHPDINALTMAIEQNNNYEVYHQFVKDFNGDYSAYSLLIAFHIEINKAPIPTFYVWGAKTIVNKQIGCNSMLLGTKFRGFSEV